MISRDTYLVSPYPASRIATPDLGQVALRKHHSAGLLEVDVTNALIRLKEQSRAKQGVSFFAWTEKLIGAVVTENRCVQAVSRGKKSTVVFEDIDNSTVVERKVEGVRVPPPIVIRRANENEMRRPFIHAFGMEPWKVGLVKSV